MNTFKDIDIIDNILNEFLKPYGVSAEFGANFAYWYEQDKIEYSVLMPEQASDWFMENFNRLAPDIKCDPFLASFLHEIGHVETMHLIDNIEECYCRDNKERISNSLTDFLTEEEEKQLYQEYFDLPDEYEATMWAINYIRNNEDKITEFWNKLKTAIVAFFEANEIEVA